ncbi:MAG: hypothetical protein K1X88_00600 [Nannocystaceae bacterium]|nr:hypothetical protein [Nannocystaceae bacterium]
MGLHLDALAMEMLCDSLSDGVVVFHDERAVVASEGACELLATPQVLLLGADVDAVFARLGLPAPWAMRLRAGDPVCTTTALGQPLRLRWLTLPGGEGSSFALVVQDMRLGRALRSTEDRLEAAGTGLGAATQALPPGAILRYLAREVRRSHLDFEELSVLVAAAGDAARARRVAARFAATLTATERVGPCDPLERVASHGEGGETVVSFPRTAMPIDHVLVVLPCTAAAGRDAVALRLSAAAIDGAALLLGGATLQVRSLARRAETTPRDGARDLLERALRDLARVRADPAHAGRRAA